MEKAFFAGGCFWCTETIFTELLGVLMVVPGYMGGHQENPTYEQVCQGTTGHAEVIEVDFDPELISYEELLDIFFATHNPTTLNRQGADVGTQYRSEIFYTSESQKLKAEQFITALQQDNVFDDPIVTQISKAPRFYKAEDHHLNYYKQNPNQPYCEAVINPKLQKFRKNFKDKLKQ